MKALFVLAVISILVSTSLGKICWGKYGSCMFKYQKKKGAIGWQNVYSDKGERYEWCVQIWGSTDVQTDYPLELFSTRLRRIGKCKCKKCRKRRSSGGRKCNTDKGAEKYMCKVPDQ